MDFEQETVFVMAIFLALLAAKNYIRCREHYAKKLASFERGKKDAKETFQKVEFTEKCADNNDEEGKNSFTQATENVDEVILQPDASISHVSRLR